MTDVEPFAHGARTKRTHALARDVRKPFRCLVSTGVDHTRAPGIFLYPTHTADLTIPKYHYYQIGLVTFDQSKLKGPLTNGPPADFLHLPMAKNKGLRRRRVSRDRDTPQPAKDSTDAPILLAHIAHGAYSGSPVSPIYAGMLHSLGCARQRVL